MFRQDKRLRNCEDMPLAGTMLTAVLFVAGGLISFARVQSAELSVELRVSPRVQKCRISPYVFGAGIDHKTNPLRAPKYPEKILKDIAESGLRIARYPGGFVFNRNDHRGSWANFYWQDHIGKNPERKPTEVYDLVPFIDIQRPRSEAKRKPDDPDINFTTSHEFAVSFLEHLNVKVDYFDWHFY